MIAALLVLAASAAAPPDPRPITVTGHAWAPFISPMGEPFRARTATDDTLADWFRQADANHDGVLTAAEMEADAARYFATLDTNHDGQIDPDELSRYEWDVAPEIQVMSRTRRAPGDPAPAVQKRSLGDDEGNWKKRREREREGEASLGIGGALQGAARYALLNIPEPVASADTDFNRAITLQEFEQAALERFRLLDRANAGRISLAQLEAMPHAPPTDRRSRNRRLDDNAPDNRIGSGLPTGP